MDTQLYLVLSQEIKQCLFKNNISLIDLFLRDKIDATIEYCPDPTIGGEFERDKEIIPKIVTNSVALFLVISSITSLIEQIYMKPYVVEVYENQELRDTSGNVIFNPDGTPILKITKKHEMIQPRKEEIERELNVSLDLTKGVLIKLKESRN